MSGATENEIMFQVTFKDALEVDCYSGFFSVHVRYMLSPVRLSVCHMSAGNARAPYSGGCNFPQLFYGIWYLGHPLTSTENFTEIVPGEPLHRGS